MGPKDGKVFCAESEQLLKTWVAGIRLAKVSMNCCHGNKQCHLIVWLTTAR